MKTSLDCIPCFLKQVLNTCRAMNVDAEMQRKILDEVAKLIPTFSLELFPPEIIKIIYSVIYKISGNRDPYKQIKEKYNNIALKLYPYMKKLIKSSKDPLLTAVRLAITGNIIDFGAVDECNMDINREIEINLEKKFGIFDYEDFVQFLQLHDDILYLADNAGEVVFDRLLIEELYGKNVIYVVKSGPAINDAMEKDAIDCGIDKIATIMQSGSDVPGTLLSICDEAFLKVFNESKFIISKGQGNYEVLSDVKRPIFFLLKAKCYIAAQSLDCQTNDIILKKQIY
jgi:damage-control phosphatase, subfamily I